MEEFKIEYISSDGLFKSKAYIDSKLSDGTYSGTNKYTDEVVIVKAQDDGTWKEVN